MKLKALFTVGLFLHLSSNIFATVQLSLEGQTYNYLGPNCFGVALHATGKLDYIRGVDLKEFDETIKRNCNEVEIPSYGDIGTFSSGSEFIHAFVVLDRDLVLEKTGVDYAGKTPVLIRDFAHTKYTFEASPECRRWGGGSKECFNKLKYYNCNWNDEENRDLKSLELKIEKSFELILTGQASAESLNNIREGLIEYKEFISTSEPNKYYLAKFISYSKQLEFIESRIKD